MIFPRPTRPAVFSTGVDDIQLWWGRLPAGSYTVDAGRTTTSIEHRGGAGAVTVGIQPTDEPVDVRLRRNGDTLLATRVRLLERPFGERLTRFATVSDLHIGEDHFGFFGRMREHSATEEDYPVRCARASLEAARQWGAEQVVVKGDITHHSTHDTWMLVQKLFAETDLPCVGIVGNHDGDLHRRIAWEEGVADVDMDVVSRVGHRDLDGIRIILVHTSVPTFGFGRIKSASEEVCQLAAEADTPCLVVLHHNLQPLPFFYFWPYGIPPMSGIPFSRRLAQANPRSVITAGHTHRNRVRRRSGLVYTEVGSTKDYPGVWGSYEVFEGGLVQVNRRIEARDCVEWLEYSRRCTGGAWGRWTPGRLDDRRFVARWDRPAD